MRSAEPACIACRARLAAGQEYCLECGARQRGPRPQWRRVAIAATLTVVVAIAVLLISYARMSDDADRAAGIGDDARGATVKQAGASDPAAAPGSRQRPAAARLAAR
jgi:hypothetical protein